MPVVKDIIVRKPTKQEIAACSVWPIWNCPPSTFDYEYDDRETCLVLEGKVTISSKDNGDTVNFTAGDLVIFPKGLQCVWTVHEAIKKHYNFG